MCGIMLEILKAGEVVVCTVADRVLQLVIGGMQSLSTYKRRAVEWNALITEE